MTIKTVGFVGIGSLGSAMVEHLLAKGYTVIGWNRTRSKVQPLLEAGMQWRDSPQAVVTAVEATFSVMADTKALEAVFLRGDGVLAGLSPGKIFADMATVDPEVSKRLAVQASDKGAFMLDCPVSGSVISLRANKLLLMAGGAREAFERIKSILLDLGPNVTYLGPNGSAVTLKLGINLALGVHFVAFAEALLMAEKAGIDRQLAVETYLKSAVASPALAYRAPFLLAEQERVLWSVNMMQKDMLLALGTGRNMGIPLPTTAAANEILTGARGLGLAEEEFSVVYDVLARLSGR